jgi:hypothetical protein
VKRFCNAKNAIPYI